MRITQNQQQESFIESNLLKGTDHLQTIIEDTLNKGILNGQLCSNLNVQYESVILLGLINGLGTAVLLEQQSLENAKESFLYQINKLLAKKP